MSVPETIDKLSRGQEVTAEEIAEIIASTDETDTKLLFAEARRKRDSVFGDKIFTYGFVYFSTYCKNNCTFCNYRRDNPEADRYRKTKSEVLALSASLEEAGVDLVDLTMGEDPKMHADCCKELIELVKGVRETVDIGIMVSPGAIPEAAFPKLKEAGADFFACYQETYDKAGYDKLRVEQDYDFRVNQRKFAKDAGMLAEDGLLVGLGETPMELAQSILRMGGYDQVRAMTFVPQNGTPLEDNVPMTSILELKAIALMRLLYPDRLIPATLDVEGIKGMVDRLDAGANVVTSIIPPHMHLAGVAQPEMDIEDGSRDVKNVMDQIRRYGKRPATQQEYREYIQGRMSQ